MTSPTFTDEILMAYVDGELDAENAAKVDAAILADPKIAERIALFDVTRQTLADDLSEPEPVSANLVAAVEAIAARHAEENLAEEQLVDAGETEPQKPTAGETAPATVVPFRTRSAPQDADSATGMRQGRVWHLPLAASIALVAGLALGPLMPWSGGMDGGRIDIADSGSQTPGASPSGLAAPGLQAPGLGTALASVVSGERTTLDDGSAFSVIASFTDGDDTLCREFEIDQTNGETLVSVACHEDETWTLRFAVAAGQGTDGFAPASSLDALDGYLTAIEAGEPLSPDAERSALTALQAR